MQFSNKVSFETQFLFLDASVSYLINDISLNLSESEIRMAKYSVSKSPLIQNIIFARISKSRLSHEHELR